MTSIGADRGTLSVDSLTVARAGRRAIADLSFEVHPGDVVAVVGPNGAGKSTLLEAILGLLPVTAGRVAYGGRVLAGFAERCRVFSYMPDEAEPPSEVRVATLISCAERFAALPADLVRDLLQRLRLVDLMRERAGRLSRGQKRRLTLFTALCTSNPIVVLDEPLAAFDPLQLLEILPVLRERAAAGAAVLLSVHQMADAAKLASHVLVLDAGELVAFATLARLRELSDRREGSLESVVIELLRRRETHARA